MTKCSISAAAAFSAPLVLAPERALALAPRHAAKAATPWWQEHRVRGLAPVPIYALAVMTARDVLAMLSMWKGETMSVTRTMSTPVISDGSLATNPISGLSGVLPRTTGSEHGSAIHARERDGS